MFPERTQYGGRTWINYTDTQPHPAQPGPQLRPQIDGGINPPALLHPQPQRPQAHQMLQGNVQSPDPFPGNNGPGGLGRYPAGGTTPPPGQPPGPPQYMGTAVATTHEMDAMDAQNRIQNNLAGANHYGEVNSYNIQTHNSQGERLQDYPINPGPAETTQVHMVPQNGRPYHHQNNPLQGFYNDATQAGRTRPVGEGRSDGMPDSTNQHVVPNAAVVSHTHPYTGLHQSQAASAGDMVNANEWNARYSRNYPGENPPTHITQTPAEPLPNGGYSANPYIRYDGRTNSWVNLIPNPAPGTNSTPPPHRGFNLVPPLPGAPPP